MSESGQPIQQQRIVGELRKSSRAPATAPQRALIDDLSIAMRQPQQVPTPASAIVR